MSMLLPLLIESERARATAAAVQAWRREQNGDPSLSELEDAARSALSGFPVLRELVGKTLTQGIAGALEDVDRTWQALVNVLDTCKEALSCVRDLARKASERENLPVTVAVELDAAIEELTRLGQEAYDSWPLDDPAKLAAAREYARQSLPNDKLLELAKEHPPPQSWYDEESKPPRSVAMES